MACCQHDYRVRFVTAAELVTMLVEAQQERRLARKLAPLARFDVVIADELGYVPLDKAGADLLFGFISQRYERCSLVVTTNLPFARWSEVFLDPTAAAAVIDRIVHHATVLTSAPAKVVDAEPASARQNAQLRRTPDSDNPRCRADQRDRVLTGVKARRCATPPLRGAAALTPAPRTVTGNLARQPENHFFKEGGTHRLTH